ncbi:MAG: hypothetical protein HRU33_17850 [Rhodobacteraceae bacterium]|nr:hypothetical protein [Paracoccaceae bacterium]
MITLQNFISPEQQVCTEQALYFHAQGPVGFSQTEGRYLMGRGVRLSFNTYFNLFNLSKWNTGCQLDGLFAEISGAGQAEIRVIHTQQGQSCEVVHCELTQLQADSPYVIDLSEFSGAKIGGLLYVEVLALDDKVSLTRARFATNTVPETLPQLAVSITTFKREAEVRRTVERFEAFLPEFEFGEQVQVQVVDNGNSAEIQASKQVTPIINPNYGGAGGFARGLLEAEKSGASHCLFMDDDASFHMENIVRAYIFLALAKDRKAAVSGAMINNTHKWAMWENGAHFDGSCHPLFCGTDLRDPDQVVNMELISARQSPANLYGGWWFFAFAIDQVKHHPFPFFVRGDDISFSLMNDFSITTLNGVVSFQDDFSAKESPQTLYLDLRNHLIHHLVVDRLQRSAFGTAKIALRFIARSLLRFHYDSAEAQLLAWQDMMRGPEFFDENIDMAARRAQIKALTTTEVWQDIDPNTVKQRHKYTRRSGHRRHRLGIYSLNGHLLPLSAQRWDRIILEIGERGQLHRAFGAAQITYLNTAQTQGYTVTQSKRRFFSICWRMTKTLVQFLRGHDPLKATYRQGYNRMTSKSYWQKKLYKSEDLAEL